MGISTPDLLDEAIRNDKDLLERLERERSCIDKRIGEVKEHLSQLLAVKNQSANQGNGSAPTRRRKGENSRAIHALFDAEPNAALTKQEISDRTGLPFSSVQAVLDREDSGFVTEGGLFRRKRPMG
jgi:hypothetical protein